MCCCTGSRHRVRPRCVLTAVEVTVSLPETWRLAPESCPEQRRWCWQRVFWPYSSAALAQFRRRTCGFQWWFAVFTEVTQQDCLRASRESILYLHEVESMFLLTWNRKDRLVVDLLGSEKAKGRPEDKGKNLPLLHLDHGQIVVVMWWAGSLNINFYSRGSLKSRVTSHTSACVETASANWPVPSSSWPGAVEQVAHWTRTWAGGVNESEIQAALLWEGAPFFNSYRGATHLSACLPRTSWWSSSVACV